MDNNSQELEKQEIQKILSDYEEKQESSDLGKHMVLFFAGLALAGGGLFLVLQNTTLYTSFSLMDFLGFTPPFGLVLLPFLFGVGVLFFNEKSILGWLLVIFGMATIILGIIMGLKIFFKPVSLYEGLLMFGMIASGVGMVAKAFSNKRL